MKKIKLLFILVCFLAGNSIFSQTITLDSTSVTITEGPFFEIDNNPLIDDFNRDIAFNTDGTRIFIIGDSGDEVNQLTLSTAFDVSTISPASTVSFSISSDDNAPRGIAFDTDGTKMFILSNQNKNVYEYQPLLLWEI